MLLYLFVGFTCGFLSHNTTTQYFKRRALENNAALLITKDGVTEFKWNDEIWK